MSGQTGRAAYEWLQKHPYEVFHYGAVADGVGCRPELVEAALGRIVKVHPETGIRRAQRGSYVYRPSADRARLEVPEPEPSSGLYEQVGKAGDGTVVVRSEDGKLWKLAAL